MLRRSAIVLWAEAILYLSLPTINPRVSHLLLPRIEYGGASAKDMLGTEYLLSVEYGLPFCTLLKIAPYGNIKG